MFPSPGRSTFRCRSDGNNMRDARAVGNIPIVTQPPGQVSNCRLTMIQYMNIIAGLVVR